MSKCIIKRITTKGGRKSLSCFSKTGGDPVTALVVVPNDEACGVGGRELREDSHDEAVVAGQT